MASCESEGLPALTKHEFPVHRGIHEVLGFFVNLLAQTALSVWFDFNWRLRHARKALTVDTLYG